MVRDLTAAYLGKETEATELYGGEPSWELLLERAQSSSSLSSSVIESLISYSSHLPEDLSRDAAIRKLQAGAKVVITGQQPALVGGSLLTTYKIATTIHLADRLSRAGCETVPMFWNASEDHDLDEANRLYFRSDDDSVGLYRASTEGRGPLDQVKVDSLDVAGVDLPAEDQPMDGESFGAWFSRLIANRFRGQGLLIVEPRAFSLQLVDFRRRWFENLEAVHDTLELRRDALRSSGFGLQLEHPQRDDSLHFFIDENGRRKISKSDDSTKVGGEPIEWSSLLERTPESFSSSAFARPVAQQVLFDPIAQISGPAEIRYLAQLIPLFDLFEVDAPLAIPRMRAVLLNGRDERDLKALGSTRPPTTKEDWLSLERAGLDSPWIQDFDDLRLGMIQGVEGAVGVHGDDGFYRQTMNTLKKGIEKALQKARVSLEREVDRRAGDRPRRIHRLKESLLPRGRPQERVFGFSAFKIVDRGDLVDHLIRIADPFDQDLRVVSLDHDVSS